MTGSGAPTVAPGHLDAGAPTSHLGPRTTLYTIVRALSLPVAALVLSALILSGSGSVFSDQTGNAGNSWAAAATFGADVELANGWTTGLTHTAGSGTDRLLILVAGMENNGDRDLTAVTYGGQAMTQANEAVVCSGTGYCGRNEVWYLDEAGIQAATGTGFSPTWSGTPSSFNEMYAAVTLSNVDQATPIGDTSSQATETANPIQVAAPLNVTNGDLVLVGATSGNAGSYTPGSGYTEDTDQAAASSTTATAHRSINGTGTEQPSMTYDAAINRQVITGTVIEQ